MKKYLVLLLILVCGYASKGQEGKINILFLGNSYTYYNGLPSMISAMALHQGQKVVVTQITRGGNLLDEYTKEEFVTETIRNGHFDFVVLQEQSTAPLFQPDSITFPAIRKLDRLIQESGGQTVLFMTWAREYGDSISTKMLPGKFYYDVFDSYNQAQDSLANSYLKIGHEIGAKVAPVGLVWKEIFNRHPDLTLWRNDHNHPTEIGTVMAAYTLYATIFNTSVKNVRCQVPAPRNLVEEIKQVADQIVTSEQKLPE